MILAVKKCDPIQSGLIPEGLKEKKTLQWKMDPRVCLK